jgi:hypothetical protein
LTAAERDELVADLRRARVCVLGVEPRPAYAHEPGGVQVRAWCEQPAHAYTVSDAAGFREAVRAGIVPDIPRGALDS